MDQDNLNDILPSDDQSHRRSFGGLGKGPAALLLAAGLLIGGGIGGFVVANAASSSLATMARASTTAAASHPCPNMGGSTAN
jgi:hypothetical protein